MPINIEHHIKRHTTLASEKSHWDVHYARLAETFLTRKQNFLGRQAPAEFLYKDIFDNTGEFAAQQAASVHMSMTWPDSARTFTVKPTPRFRDVPDSDKYFAFATRQMQRFMDLPRAGLMLALAEFQLDMQVFGTCGVGVFEGPDKQTPLLFEAWGVNQMCVAENRQGFVDEIYWTDEFTVRQLVETYPKTVHEKVREAFNSGRVDEKVRVLKVIDTRPVNDRAPAGKLGMPVRTLVIDIANKHLLDEGGAHQFPVAVGRAIKTVGEAYGRSPAMTALPDANGLNTLKEAIIVASEKQLDPPLGVLDDGRLGGGTIDTSAGALNVFNSSGRLTGEKPVFPLYTVGDVQGAKDLAESFRESIMQAFSLDRLLDLNNQTQMTAFETSVRNRMRGEALGSMFSRQEAEVFTPLINRSFKMLWRAGLLQGDGDVAVPDEIARAIEADNDAFIVEYVSPAKRFMQSEKLQGIFTLFDFAGKLSVVPGAEVILDNFDFDAVARNVTAYSGAPVDVLRPKSAVESKREGRTAAQAQMAEVEKLRQLSEAARNGAQAQNMAGGVI